MHQTEPAAEALIEHAQTRDAHRLEQRLKKTRDAAQRETVTADIAASAARTESRLAARPDIALAEGLPVTERADEIREAITKAGLPNLAVPREIKVLEEIPVLGSGKTNYPELSKLVAG